MRTLLGIDMGAAASNAAAGAAARGCGGAGVVERGLFSQSAVVAMLLVVVAGEHRGVNGDGLLAGQLAAAWGELLRDEICLWEGAER